MNLTNSHAKGGLCEDSFTAYGLQRDHPPAWGLKT